MKLYPTSVRASVITILSFIPATLSAQDEMKDMPGMTPEAKPAAKKPAPAKDEMTKEEMDAMPGMKPTKPAPKDDMEGMPGMEKPATSKDKAMDAMPGMKPTKPAPKDDMEGMPGMEKPAASKDQAMDAMPGMNTGKKSTMKGGDDMAGMPGMEQNGAATPPRMSAPGITILRPPQKWVPPRGDNRSAELLSRSELEEHMRPLPAPVMDSMFYSFSLFELLEYRANSAGPDTFSWDFVGWYGGDFNRLWVKTEGSQDLDSGNDGTGDLQLLYGRLIAPFWDLQAGIRTKFNLGSSLDSNTRTYAVIGLQGIAPGNFDIEPAIYLSDRGEVSAELTASYDLYLTQRLILQPRFQGEISFKGDDRFGTGEGVTETDIGLRLRYEITREIAPYIGVSWMRSYGQTGRIARQQGESSDAVAFVAGIRIWF